MRNIFGVKSKTVGSAAILLSVASLASRVFGLVRDRLLAGTFGAGLDLDAYYAAFRIPDLFYSLFVFGAISAAFIPVFSRFSDDGGESDRQAVDLVSRVLTLMAVSLAILAVLGWIWAPLFTPIITPGFGPEQVELTVRLTRIMFLPLALLGLSGVFGAVLQTRKRFLIYALAPVLYNVGIIFGITALSGRFGIVGVAWGVVIGAIMHFAVQAWACRSLGLRFRPDFDFRHSSIREIVRLTTPRIVSLAATNLHLLVVTSMMTALGVGSLAVFNFSQNLIYVPINMIGISVAVAAFPFISEMAEKEQHAEMVEAINRSARTIIFLVVPTTVAFLLLRAQIVRVILGSGRFDWADTIATADALACFSLGLFASALVPLLIRAFFAVKDTVTPLLTNVFFAVAGIVMAWLAIRQGYGVVGVAASVALANSLNLAVLWVALRLRLGSLGEARIFRAVAVLSLCGLAMAITTQAIKIFIGSAVDMYSFFGVFTQGAVAGIAGFACYILMAIVLGNHEVRQTIVFIRHRLTPAPVAIRQEEESIVPEP